MAGKPAKAVLFVTPYPHGQAASQRFRFEHFYTTLDREGVRHDEASFWDDAAWRILYKPGHTIAKVLGFVRGATRRFLLLFVLHRYDVVFIHREAAPLGPPLFEWMTARLFDKPIVYDFDDAIWLPNVSDANRSVGSLKWHRKVGDICRWSRRIMAGNSYLADFARQFNDDVVVFPTVLDTKRHSPVATSRNDDVVVGWTGSHSTVSYLELIVPALRQLAEQSTFRFRLIADRTPDFDIPNLEFVEWRKATEIEDLAAIDIGVMPIPDTEWARGKCGLKILQYMAMGIPTVASAVGVNSDIVSEGVDGWLASTNDEWVRHLRVLMDDADKRHTMGLAAREKAVGGYSVEATAQKFVAALCDL